MEVLITGQERTFSILSWLEKPNFSSKTMKALLNAMAVNEEASLVGGTLREKILKCDKIPHADIERLEIVAGKFEQAIGFKMPDIRSELRHSYEVHKPLRELELDLDIIVTESQDKICFNPLIVACTAVISNLDVNRRNNPNGASFYRNRIKVDATDAEPSPHNARTASCYLSIDRLSLPIKPTGTDFIVKADAVFLNQQLELKVIGDMSTMYTERAISLAVGFISKSQIQRDGKKIDISFGDTKEEARNTWELLILSLSIILMNKDKYQKYYDRLFYNILNWDNLDPRIQKIITLAFQFVNHQQKSQPISNS